MRVTVLTPTQRRVRRRAPWRVTLWAAERRYRAAERARGREYAKRYDYIPF